MSKMFLRKWKDLANERVNELEKLKEKNIRKYQGDVLRQKFLERTLRDVNEAIEFNKEIIQLLKVA